MSKFKVMVTETVTTCYATVEVEADSEEDAMLKAEEMALDGEIEEGNGSSSWSSEIVP